MSRIGVIVVVTVLPLALLMRRRPSAKVIAEAEAATRSARADVGISPRLLMALLIVAGFSCCVGDVDAAGAYRRLLRRSRLWRRARAPRCCR